MDVPEKPKEKNTQRNRAKVSQHNFVPFFFIETMPK